MQKANADMAYLARELCDSVFKPSRQSLVILSTKSRMCEEWWLDGHGRYESAELYCAFSPSDDNTHTLACQDRVTAGRYSVVDLKASGDVYERVGDLIGYDMGRAFKTLAACLKYRAKK